MALTTKKKSFLLTSTEKTRLSGKPGSFFSVCTSGSDTATIIASLPLFKKEVQNDFKKWAENPKIKQPEFNQKAARLLHEVKLEKPAFKDEIIKKDLLDCFLCYQKKEIIE